MGSIIIKSTISFSSSSSSSFLQQLLITKKKNKIIHSPYYILSLASSSSNNNRPSSYSPFDDDDNQKQKKQENEVTNTEKYNNKGFESEEQYVKNLEGRLAALEKVEEQESLLSLSNNNELKNKYPEISLARQLIEKITPTKPMIKVQGGSLKTWTYNSAAVEAVHVIMKTD